MTVDTFRVLGLPALLCWVFSAWLMSADILQIPGTGQLLTFVAAESILAAALGLAYLIWAAASMLGDSSAGEPSDEDACGHIGEC